ncbi:MAG TPA: hypothetical protein VFZ72_01730 [Jiangellaceae bacterium]
MDDLRRADDLIADDPYLTGAYLCLTISADREVRDAVASLLAGLETDVGLGNEFTGTDPMPAVAYLTRVRCDDGDMADDELASADVVVHVAAPDEDLVHRYERALRASLVDGVSMRALFGQWLPMEYTGRAMHNFSYAHRVLQQPGDVAPNCFLLPLSKTPEWWSKSWMERHTYLLPRYDERGQLVAEGHVLSAAAGIDHLLRRTYRQRSGAAELGQYDFLTYFECTDDGVSHLHATLDALRDTRRNPEWAFVREGPLWQGRRHLSAEACLATIAIWCRVRCSSEPELGPGPAGR